MLFSLIYFIAILKGSIFILLLISLFAFFKLLFSLSGLNPGSFEIIVLFFVILSIPIAAYVSAALTESSILNSSNLELLPRLGFVVTCAYCLQNTQIIDYFSAAFSLVDGASKTELLVLLIKTSSVCLKTAGVVAFCILLLISMLELPFLWFCNSFSFTSQADITLAGVRPLFIFIVFFYIVEIIASFVSSRLWPAALVF